MKHRNGVCLAQYQVKSTKFSIQMIREQKMPIELIVQG